jgi:hypothetical protein
MILEVNTHHPQEYRYRYYHFELLNTGTITNKYTDAPDIQYPARYRIELPDIRLGRIPDIRLMFS